MIAASQSVEHPDCPEFPNIIRMKVGHLTISTNKMTLLLELMFLFTVSFGLTLFGLKG